MCECVHNVVDFRYRHVVCVLVLSQCVTSVSCVCLCVGGVCVCLGMETGVESRWRPRCRYLQLSISI